MKVALYTRVSTPDQNPDLQIRELSEYASRQGWEVTATYQDVISGAKASRPGLDQLKADLVNRKFDCVLVWKLDRFGRSALDLLTNLLRLWCKNFDEREPHGPRSPTPSAARFGLPVRPFRRKWRLRKTGLPNDRPTPLKLLSCYRR